MLQVQDPLAYLAMAVSFGQIAAAIAIIPAMANALGQGKIGASAVEAIARQPEAKGSITSTMFISLAIAETGGIYALLISIILLFANPLVGQLMTAAGL